MVNSKREKKIKPDQRSRQRRGSQIVAKIDVEYVARLANLELSEKEKAVFGKQLADILGYIEQIEKVPTADISPIFNVSSNKNVTREDKVEGSLPQKKALLNGKSVKNGYFVTGGVFDNE